MKKYLSYQKLLCLGCFLFCFSFISYAQETFEEPFYEPPLSDCGQLSVSFSQVVECHSSSTFYAQINLIPLIEQNLEVTYFINGEEFTAIINNENELIIEDLPPGIDITLFGSNICGEIYPLTAFNTALDQGPNDQIIVTPELAHVLNGYTDEVEEVIAAGEGNVSVYQHVTDSEEISRYEKMAFIQQFYYDSNPLPDNLCGDIPPPPPPPNPPTDCICNWIVSTNSMAIPGGLNDATGLVNDSFRSFVIDDGNGADGGGWEGAAGPAHGRFFYLDAWKHDRGNFHEVTGGDLVTDPADPGFSTNQASIYYQLICEGIANPPSNCDCEKTIDVAWHYNVWLSAEAKLLGGGGKKKSRTQIDEIASVIAEVEGEAMQVLDVGSATARAECNKELNTGLLTGIGSMAIGAAAIALGGASALGGVGVTELSATTQQQTAATTTTTNGAGVKVTTPNNSINVTASNGSLITAGAGLFISGLTQTFSEFGNGFFVGECGQQSGSAVLVNGSRTFVVAPNKGVEITLSAFTTANVGGQWKYQSKAFSFSEFFLGVKIPENVQTIDSDCCSPAVGSYVASSWRDAPGLPEFNGFFYLSEIASFFNQEPVWNDSNFDPTREWGNVVGPAPTVCEQNTEIDQNFAMINRPGAFIESRAYISSDGVTLNATHRFEADQLSQKMDYVLFDINGRVLNSGEFELFDGEAFISNTELYKNSNIPENGIYFLHVSNSTSRQVLKLVY